MQEGEVQVPEQLNENAGLGGRESRNSQPVFTRPMPGGGSVRVELLVSDRGDIARERLRGRVVMVISSQGASWKLTVCRSPGLGTPVKSQTAHRIEFSVQ